LSSAHPSTHGSIGHSAQTLQLNRKKSSGSKQTYNSLQRHSSGGNLDYDNVENDCAPSSGPRLSNMGSSFGGNMTSNGSRSRTLGDGLDELADIALHSESDSVRDECSSGIRSEAEDEERGRPPVPGRRLGQLGSTPNHLSLSTTSSLSSCSNPSQARLVQSSLKDSREGGQPPAPPPRTSSATSATSSVDNGGNGGPRDLGSPIWKPRDHGSGSGNECWDACDTGSDTASEPPRRTVSGLKKYDGLEPNQTNGKTETLQSSCQMLDALLLELTAFS